MATINDLNIYKGSAVVQPFQMVPPLPSTLTGRQITFTLRESVTGPVVIQKACVVTGEQTYEVRLTSVETKTLAAGRYVYDCQFVEAGLEDVLSIGRVNLLQEVLYP